MEDHRRLLVRREERLADHTAFLYMGELVEYGVGNELFTRPKVKRTQDYVEGRFG